MKNKILFIAILSMFISCKENKKSDINNTKAVELNDGNSTLELDSFKVNNPDTLIFQDDKLISKSEFTMYGDGVANLIINEEVIIYNQDESVFGRIFFSEESESFIMDNFPKEIKARYFVPILEQFYFDAIRPDKNDSFLKIFINSEIKKVKKEKVNFKFIDWDKYIKENFINIRKINSKSELDKNTYKVIKIEKDSALIESISLSDCDLIENSDNNVSKKIKWKDDNLLLISLFECN
ncbi:hypothetical protein FIA58_020910 [Flavobacterium jejuense]|uniref:Lipoprotein n=1 Tax=Flavobacterium jejuense TaxID=1544455 RepID=A0ABX0IX67_9FLAO|nr:hypothetical protein [Flavobacterium jejuense]NHN28146.1 hypothetical protein [Flavobacterium jejuense]